MSLSFCYLITALITGLPVAVEQGSQAAGVTGVVVEIIYARLLIDPDLHYVDRALRIDLFKTFF